MRNNEDLSAALLGCCNPEKIPIRMIEISETIETLPNLKLSNDEITTIVRRIFEACRAEDGRPKHESETDIIIADVVVFLKSRVKKMTATPYQKQVNVLPVKRMPAHGSFA